MTSKSDSEPREPARPAFQGLDRLDPAVVAALPPMRVALAAETLPMIRASLNERRAQFVAGFDTGFVSVEHGAVRTPERPVDVRVYRGTAERSAPTLAFFHGGALVMGNLDTDHLRCVALARDSGCVVVSVDYRLAPEFPYPAALEDCASVVAALAARPEELGVDPTRLAVGGNSAGAGLAAAIALRLRDEGGPALCLQLMHQPMLDWSCATPSMKEFTATPAFDAEGARFSWHGYLAGRPATAYAAAAAADSLAGLPSAYLCCSEVDPLRDEAIDYARRLVEAGVSVELHLVPGTCHGFDSLVPAHPRSVRALADEAAALRQAFGA
jgi:acetyl esterase